MRLWARVLLVAVGVVAFPAPALAAEEVTVLELIEFAEHFGGLSVTVEGELVGDYGFRSDGTMWSQLNGDVYARAPLRETGSPSGSNVGIGVRMPATLGDDLGHPGGYRWRGPVVRVTGVWKYHDAGRQGESYLDVVSLEVVEPARELRQSIDWWAVGVGAALFLVGALLWTMGKPRDDRRPTLSELIPWMPLKRSSSG